MFFVILESGVLNIQIRNNSNTPNINLLFRTNARLWLKSYFKLVK